MICEGDGCLKSVSDVGSFYFGSTGPLCRACFEKILAAKKKPRKKRGLWRGIIGLFS